MKTQITTVEQLKQTMFDFQVRKRWISLDDILRKASGKPEPRPGNLQQAAVRTSDKIVLRALIRCFSVDEKGYFRTKGVFNEYGFRKCGYRQFAKWLAGRTISKSIAFLREVGIITAYQERNPDGSMGTWWVRLNPDVLIQWAEFKPQLTPVLSPSPAATMCELSSSKNCAVVSAAVDPAIVPVSPAVGDGGLAVKKKIEPPVGGSNFPSENGEQTMRSTRETEEQFEMAARKAILATPVGKIVDKLKSVFPDMDKLTVKQLLQLERIVGDPVPQKRLDEKTVDDLSYIISDCPEELGKFSNVQHFAVVLDHWNAILKSIWQWRLARHDEQIDDVKDATRSLDCLLFDPDVTLQNLHGRHPEDEHTQLNRVQCLVRSITHKWPAQLAALYVEPVSKFLVNRPLVYQMVVERFPQIRTMCNISRSTHLRLLEEVRRMKADCSVWNGIKDYYGFET